MTISFKEWILKFCHVDRPIGHFANMVANDPSFPEENDFHIVFQYLMTKSRNQTETNILRIWEAYHMGL